MYDLFKQNMSLKSTSNLSEPESKVKSPEKTIEAVAGIKEESKHPTKIVFPAPI
jgi:hypothetical protein